MCGILEHTGRYDEPLAELEEERERQTALLEEFYIYSNPAYIYLKGDARICLEDGRELRIYHDLPMSIPLRHSRRQKHPDPGCGADDGGKSDLVSPAERGTYILSVSERLPYPHETGAIAADRQRKSGTFLASFWRSRSRRSGDRGASDPERRDCRFRDAILNCLSVNSNNWRPGYLTSIGYSSMDRSFRLSKLCYGWLVLLFVSSAICQSCFAPFPVV